MSRYRGIPDLNALGLDVVPTEIRKFDPAEPIGLLRNVFFKLTWKIPEEIKQ